LYEGDVPNFFEDPELKGLEERGEYSSEEAMILPP